VKFKRVGLHYTGLGIDTCLSVPANADSSSNFMRFFQNVRRLG